MKPKFVSQPEIAGKMRDKRFVDLHRGGSLTKEQHGQLLLWACACVENVLFLLDEADRNQVSKVLVVAKNWVTECATVADARKAALEMISLARELQNGAQEAVVRAAGHAVATAHMADHSLRTAAYVLKAAKIAQNAIEAERLFQESVLPAAIRGLVLAAEGDLAFPSKQRI